MDYQEYVSERDVDFARQFENFVNGKMYSAETTGREMANAHRYLQQKMFKVCVAFIRQLAHNHQKGYYDQRNEWASKVAAVAYKAMVEGKLVYDPEYAEAMETEVSTL